MMCKPTSVLWKIICASVFVDDKCHDCDSNKTCRVAFMLMIRYHTFGFLHERLQDYSVKSASFQCVYVMTEISHSLTNNIRFLLARNFSLVRKLQDTFVVSV